jgi:ESCRT-I complex subunit VPS28
MDCPRADERLRIGVPATFELPAHTNDNNNHGHSRSQGGNSGNPPSSARAAAEAAQNFITFLDALRLNFKAKDTLHPLLSDVITSANAVTTQGFDGREKIVQWLITLNQMKATDEISDDQLRELSFDIESAYEGMKSTLN